MEKVSAESLDSGKDADASQHFRVNERKGEKKVSGEGAFCILAPFSRQSGIPKFCHLYPEYHFLSQYRIPCQDFSEYRSPRAVKFRIFKKVCVFTNPTL